ncbi:hypothetical protein IQ16_02658 [Bradyrhizobium huanghuaihaiense]|uniref:Uncharacterized protein n=1 Tax=Bradyrhizobium huanghuaihaiense TaxID=990078 RepID=A0A562RU19_9BRAD|nr:hypothetical protein IQ16_02658 [Bradyrhizobium huanghuaihaiense]
MLKVLPPLMTAAGSIILAYRVKTIIDQLAFAQRGADANFRSLTEFLAGRSAQLPMLVGFDERVQRSVRFGTWLLVVGFALIAGGAIVNAWLLWNSPT